MSHSEVMAIADGSPTRFAGRRACGWRASSEAVRVVRPRIGDGRCGGSRSRLLDEAALEAVRWSRFVPSPDTSKKVTVSVRFVLNDPFHSEDEKALAATGRRIRALVKSNH